MTPLPETILFIKRQEGYKLHAYTDSRGFWTIGIGHLIKDPAMVSALQAGAPLAITSEFVDALFAVDIAEAYHRAAGLVPALDTESPARQTALVSMAFQFGDLGGVGPNAFPRLIDLACAQAWEGCSQEVLWHNGASRDAPSLLARQCPERAAEIAAMLSSGKFIPQGAERENQPA